MPKIVNHEEKKAQIAAATWRVIVRDGMKGATVRSIAKEASMSLGALRHYFSNQDELITYAMQLVRERANARINALVRSDLPPKQKVLYILFEIVPMNEDTRIEMEVWLAYAFAMNGRAADVYDVQGEIHTGMRRLIEFLDVSSLLRPALDKDLAAETLYALVDGIAMHALLEPQRLSNERISAVLSAYLDSICV